MHSGRALDGKKLLYKHLIYVQEASDFDTREQYSSKVHNLTHMGMFYSRSHEPACAGMHACRFLSTFHICT